MNNPTNASYDADNKAIRTVPIGTIGTTSSQLPSSLSADRIKVVLVSSGGADVTNNFTATPTVTTVSVATTSTQILAANSIRKAVIFSNVGANNIYLNLAGGTAVTTNTLIAPGGNFIWDRFVSTTAINGIAVTGATNLSVTELV